MDNYFPYVVNLLKKRHSERNKVKPKNLRTFRVLSIPPVGRSFGFGYAFAQDDTF